MTKVIWLPNETGYSYCEFVAWWVIFNIQSAVD